MKNIKVIDRKSNNTFLLLKEPVSEVEALEIYKKLRMNYPKLQYSIVEV